jgi:hypothetical protein
VKEIENGVLVDSKIAEKQPKIGVDSKKPTNLASLSKLTDLVSAKNKAPSKENSLKELLLRNSEMANLLLQIIEYRKASRV